MSNEITKSIALMALLITSPILIIYQLENNIDPELLGFVGYMLLSLDILAGLVIIWYKIIQPVRRRKLKMMMYIGDVNCMSSSELVKLMRYAYGGLCPELKTLSESTLPSGQTVLRIHDDRTVTVAIACDQFTDSLAQEMREHCKNKNAMFVMIYAKNASKSAIERVKTNGHNMNMRTLKDLSREACKIYEDRMRIDDMFEDSAPSKQVYLAEQGSQQI